MGEKRLITASTAADILGVSVPTLRRWTRNGIVPTFRDPETGRIRYSRPALEKWLEANCPKPAAS